MTTLKPTIAISCVSLLMYSVTFSQDPIPVSEIKHFDIERDLLLAQYDCKTDVDDLHSAAAFATILAQPQFAELKFHAVAGAYGIQEGLYVLPNELFLEAFGNSWSDAHGDFEQAVQEVSSLVMATLAAGGDAWIAEGGQSDFSAAVLSKIHASRPDINTRSRIHLVQHSDWNEEVTSPEKLQYVKEFTDYHKIPDGNVAANGSPGFRTEKGIDPTSEIKDPHLLEIWDLAISLGNQYNGKEGRYRNVAVAKGGLDFSDTVEVTWILGLYYIKDTNEFFELFGR